MSNRFEEPLLDLFHQGGIKLNRRIKMKDERLKLTCRSHTFKTVLKVRRGNTLVGIYEMVYPIILPSIRYRSLYINCYNTVLYIFPDSSVMYDGGL